VFFGDFLDYQIQLAKALISDADVVFVIPKYHFPEEFPEHVDQNISIQIYKYRKQNRLNTIRNIFHLMSVIRREKLDIAHIQLGGNWLDFAFFMYFRFIKKLPTVVTFHDVKLHLGEERLSMKIWRHWIRQFSDKIIVHGQKLRSEMITYYRISPEKVVSIPLGEHNVDTFNTYWKNDVKETGNRVLFFGRIHKYKGLEYLIKAEPLINEAVPGTKIVIAGEGEDFRKYRDLIGDRSANFIILNYHVSFEEGARLFQECSVVALPYVEASQSGVILNAYSFKKAVVTSNVGSISEIVDNKETGILVRPGNVEELASAIIVLLKDKEFRTKLGENGFHKLKRDLSFTEITKKILPIYEELLGK
jgi:glycosyltransferase involved in cell wall biosynthesis